MAGHFQILVLTKRQYTNKDLIEDRFGRIREIPLHLAHNGHTVHGLCLSYRTRRSGVFRDSKVLWESVNAGPLFIGGILLFLSKALRQALQADVIWACSDSLFGFIGLAAGRICGIPVVFDLYDNFEAFLLGRMPFIRSLYRWVVRKCDAVTVVSQPLCDLVRSYGRAKGVFILENAVDLTRFRPLPKQDCRACFNLPPDAVIVGTAGSLTKSRGIEVLFRAFQLLTSRYPNLHLALAGPRDVEIPRHCRIHDLGILKHDQIPVFFNALNLGVICNRAGAFGSYCFPQKLREMMACKLAYVAADVGSMKDLVGENRQWLFAPDDPQHLARVIENRLKCRSSDDSLPPSWEEMARVLDGIIHNILKINQ